MDSDERRSDRANVILTAMIEHSQDRIPVRIRNLSEHGALVVGDGLPAADTAITFRCNGQAVEGWVAWSRGKRAGIAFGKPTRLDALTKREQRQGLGITKDTREISVRRPGFRGNQLSEEERKIVEAWTKRSQEKQ
jgi:PilZ domain